MKNYIKTIALAIFICSTVSCKKTSSQINKKSISYNLNDEIRRELVDKIEEMGVLDQKYRTPLSIGTLNEDILAKVKKMSQTSDVKKYIAFKKTIKRTLTKSQEDSLWKLQKELDYKNHIQFKSIVKEYGYPSPERLHQKTDNIYAILLHPPTNTRAENEDYLKEMSSLLKDEVIAKRMDANNYAAFIDNIKSKILNDPQLYGTMKTFNPATMKEGLPKIKNVKETNIARKEIGLDLLKEGEYIIVTNN